MPPWLFRNKEILAECRILVLIVRTHAAAKCLMGISLDKEHKYFDAAPGIASPFNNLSFPGTP